MVFRYILNPSQLSVALATSLLALAGSSASAQIINPNSLIAPVEIQYGCPTQTGSLPTCTTSYVLPKGAVLVVQNISGSATPIAPNAAGTFATGQASLTVTSSLNGGSPVTNIVGPNYAIGNTAIWFFNTPTTIYSTTLPQVANNGGTVAVQGYIISQF